VEKIDLSLKGILANASLEPRFSELLDSKGKDFTFLVDIASEKFKDDLDWWMSVPASRSPFMGDLYQKYCQILLIQEILSGKEYEDLKCVEVDSNGIKKCVDSLRNNLKVKVKRNKYLFLKSRLRFLLTLSQIIKILIFKLSLHILFKVTKRRRPIETDSLIIIDTFVFPGYVNYDRYYTDLIQKVPEKYSSKIYFVPTIVLAGFKEMYSLVKEIRNSSRPFLLKEDLLTINDIASSFFHYIRIKRLKLPTMEEGRVDFSHIFKEEISQTKASSLIIDGFLTYAFFKRCKNIEVKIDSVVDWWENQPIDKALHKALADFYPKALSISYLGYAPRSSELHLFPSIKELENKVVPKNIGVIGSGFVEEIKKFNQELNVIPSPAFRFNYLWNDLPPERRKRKFILIALPVTLEDALYVMKISIKSLEKFKKGEIKVLIKLHPTMKKNLIDDNLSTKIPSDWSYSEDPSEDLLSQSKLLISSISSICLESIAFSVPLVLIEKPRGLKFNPIPDEIEQDLWKLCKNEEDVINAIDNFLYRTEEEIKVYDELSLKIRKKYFEPVDTKNVLNLLGVKETR